MDYCVIPNNFIVIYEVHIWHKQHVSHNFRIVHSLYKTPKPMSHLIGHCSPYVFHFNCHFIIWLRLSAMDYNVIPKDSNVICEVYIRYV